MEKTDEVRSGQADAPKGFEHWIIKFDGVSDTQFGVSSGYDEWKWRIITWPKQQE